MRPFTDEEFEKMISELTDESNTSFDMLYSIADRTLRSKVRYWCATNSVLSGRNMENDIMQEVFLRLIKTTVTHFLKREDSNGQINRNPDGFNSWMFTVAENIKKDMSKTLGKRYSNEKSIDDEDDKKEIADPRDYFEEDDYVIEKLAKSFQIVLDADSKVYKVLTWLANSLFVLEYDVTRIQSTKVLLTAFSEKSLFDLRDIVLKFAGKIEWIVVTPEQLDRINKALYAELALKAEQTHKHVGDIKYKDFFMKKGGKASISDWINRMDKLIESRMRK